MLGCIALGLLQRVALKFTVRYGTISACFYARAVVFLPSERTVKAVLGQELVRHFRNVAS